MTDRENLPKVENFIDDCFTEPLTHTYLPKFAPATGELHAMVAASSGRDVELATSAARRAFDGGEWRKMDGSERGRLLSRVADLLERDGAKFAEILAIEQGRPLREMQLMDIPSAVDTLRYFAGWADKIEGRCIPTRGFMGSHTLNYTTMRAVGVAALLVPWNAPLMIGVWKIAAALSAGCTVVVKPSEDAPVAITKLSELFREAGFPSGVVNVVNGLGTDAGGHLIKSPLVDTISFTGSTSVGRIVAQEAASRYKPATLELGGKAAQIVFADADIQLATQGLLTGLFVNQGQTCAAGSRILVHRSIASKISEAIASEAEAMVVGDPLDGRTQMGALISKRHLDRVKEYVQIGVQDGARLIAGRGELPDSGYFLRPTVFDQGTNHMRIAQEEIFGPVGVIIPFENDADAISMANDVRYGLSATVWTNDLTRAHRVAEQLEVGAVGINAWSPLDARLPWGGVKDSGMGNDLSKTALTSYLREKIVTVKL